MRNRTALIGLGVFVVVAAILFVPWATKDRGVIASTPVPPPLFSVTSIPLKPGQTACMNQVTFDPLSQVAEIGVGTGGKPGPPLMATLSGPGYRSVARVPAGYTDKNGPALRFDVQPPAHALLGRMCIRNAGTSEMSLNGTNEFRTSGRPALSVDGAAQAVDARLAFYARKPASYAGRVGPIFGHASTFTPGFLSQGVLILLGLLALIGIPAGAFAALAVAARDDEKAADADARA
jgi:hypothetical protein